MAEFLTESKLNAALEEIFSNAEKELIIISPYIKLHSRLKDILKKKKDNDKLRITIVFGKNNQDKTKSISKDDFVFFSEFPNIEIKYEDRLHAKFYSNYNDSLLSSMNLYDFSQNNNIEFGILTKVSNILTETVTGNHVDSDAYNYFKKTVIPNSKLIYENVPIYESGLLGLKKKYVSINNSIDLLSSEFGITKISNHSESIKHLNPNLNQIKSGSLVSATVLGKDKNLDFKEVVLKLSKEGLIDTDGKMATKKGLDLGIKLKTTDKGSWLVYPESLKELL